MNGADPPERAERTPNVQRLCSPRCQTGRPSRSGLCMAREAPRKSAIEILQRGSAIRKQVHRQAQKHFGAKWSEANHQKIPGSEGLMDPMAMLQRDDPCVPVQGGSARVGCVDDPVRRTEVQHDWDFERRQVPLVQRAG